MDFAAIMAEERANAGLAVPRSHAGKPPSPSSTKGKKSSTARAKAWKERTAREIGSPSTASIRWELRRERENLEAKDKAKDKAKKRFLGFWLTHGSGGHDHHPQRRCAYQPHPWQRQDDPYGGLM